MLTPGSYVVKVDYPLTALTSLPQTDHTFTVAAGQSSTYAVVLNLGHLAVTVDDDQGQPLDPQRVTGEAYGPADANLPFASSYALNATDLPLLAGVAYRVVLKLDNNQLLTLSNQQVSAGQVQSMPTSGPARFKSRRVAARRQLIRLLRSPAGRLMIGQVLAHMSFIAIPVQRLRETSTLLAFAVPQPAYRFTSCCCPSAPSPTWPPSPPPTRISCSISSPPSAAWWPSWGWSPTATGSSPTAARTRPCSQLHFHLISGTAPQPSR